MRTQKELKQHFINLGVNGAIYVWGANGQIITKELMDKLCKSVNSNTYDATYYLNKLKEGEGKPGADCSGAIYPVSGYDTTAHGYYGRCLEKGKIATIPRNKVCLVFKKNALGKINHVGCYTGDGYVSEMASSKKNYQRKPLDGNGWSMWGMPDFVSDPRNEMLEKLEVDGEWGKNTTYASQIIFYTEADGEVSNQKNSCKKYLPGVLTSSWKFALVRNKGSQLIKAIQNMLKDTGYYTGKIDGWCGKGTVTAIQLFLKDYGFYAGDVDGIMGQLTVRGWQMYINSRI
ncbi:MAG: peptidoglycan-binding protein [Agathobacter sp.]